MHKKPFEECEGPEKEGGKIGLVGKATKNKRRKLEASLLFEWRA